MSHTEQRIIEGISLLCDQEKRWKSETFRSEMYYGCDKKKVAMKLGKNVTSKIINKAHCFLDKEEFYLFFPTNG